MRLEVLGGFTLNFLVNQPVLSKAVEYDTWKWLPSQMLPPYQLCLCAISTTRLSDQSFLT